MGKPVISTPYWHAAELLADGRGELVPFADPAAIAKAVLGLLDDPGRMHHMRKEAYAIGRQFTWPRVGERYAEVFREARRETTAYRARLRRAEASAFARPLTPLLPIRQPAGFAGREGAGEPLPLKLDHLAALLDSTGIAQHAVHAVADRAHGYCLDDNARGLLLATTLLRSGSVDTAPLTDSLFASTTAFVQHAWNPDAQRFRNFMSYDRRWLEPVGSDDSHARAVWVLGTVAGCAAQTASRRAWALGLLERSAAPVAEFTSPRAWAFALLGAVEYLAARPEDLRFVRLRETMADRLCEHLHSNRRPDWTWFENVLSYDNARLSQAMIVAGQQAGRADWLAAGLDSLDWLAGVQRAEAGHFRPIGSEGFWRHGEARAHFDQQPLEAGAQVSACLAAWRATRSLRWLTEARRAYEWFLGSNDLGEPLHDPDTGGCRDGLLCDRVNANQGAESTLALLLATVNLRDALSDAHRFTTGEAAQAAQ
jgi:hypothetical protein